MNKEDLIKIATAFVAKSPANCISEQDALSPRAAGIRIFETPLVGLGSPDDEYFKLFKDPTIIGKHFLLPREWLPRVQTVISVFLPFSEAVRKGNKGEKLWPSAEWLHGRIEGQAFVNRLLSHLKSELIAAGYNSMAPSLDERFWSVSEADHGSAYPGVSFTSVWSERHVAFVCGLGTFGLSKGLITSKGIAGRFGSILTELALPPDRRAYERSDEYCTLCGACVERCPVKAITIDKGKNHLICSKFLDKTAVKFKPRYGCGKCQVGVPCEGKIPGR